ncbi:MAG: hypothetical protein ACOYER_08295 [Limnochordia bacterium]
MGNSKVILLNQCLPGGSAGTDTSRQDLPGHPDDCLLYLQNLL